MPRFLEVFLTHSSWRWPAARTDIATDLTENRQAKHWVPSTLARVTRLGEIVPSTLARVTSLGDFSPIGWVVTMAIFCENYSSSTNNWATCFHGKSCVLIFTKTAWATFWATFSANSSGHPDSCSHLVLNWAPSQRPLLAYVCTYLSVVFSFQLLSFLIRY
jgi:hypothetical protein